MKPLNHPSGPSQSTCPDPTERLSDETCRAIIDEVRDGLTKIFGSNLVFGFVCGGIAKGYANGQHDVDTFVCLKEAIDDETKETYYQWYFDLHRRYGLPPDYDYPGEIVTYEQLARTLQRLEGWVLTLEVDEVPQKKTIIWADMIIGGVDGVCGIDTSKLNMLIDRYKDEPVSWKRQILKLIPLEEVPKWKDKIHTLIMEEFMKYPKYDGQHLEGRFSYKKP